MKIRCFGGLFNNRLIDVGEVSPTSTPPLTQEVNFFERDPASVLLNQRAELPINRVHVVYGLARMWYRDFGRTEPSDVSDEWVYVAQNYLGDGR